MNGSKLTIDSLGQSIFKHGASSFLVFVEQKHACLEVSSTTGNVGYNLDSLLNSPLVTEILLSALQMAVVFVT